MDEAGKEKSSWSTYPKVHAIGKPDVRDLFLDDVIVEEKIDGSQGSAGKFLTEEGVPFLRFRTRGAELNVELPEKMFRPAVETMKGLLEQLQVGWTYRFEVLCKPKHNVLAYDRCPTGNVILFDINPGYEQYLSYEQKVEEANRLGLEIVPKLYEGRVENPEQLLELLQTISVLGGQKIEGLVCKNYHRGSFERSVLFGKYVSEAFKEVHQGEWKSAGGDRDDIIALLVNQYRTPARWAKARQHLKEAGTLLSDPKDIGALMKEVASDVHTECAEEIREQLWKWAWPRISKNITKGLAEWYKSELLRDAFSTEAPE